MKYKDPFAPLYRMIVITALVLAIALNIAGIVIIYKVAKQSIDSGVSIQLLAIPLVWLMVGIVDTAVYGVIATGTRKREENEAAVNRQLEIRAIVGHNLWQNSSEIKCKPVIAIGNADCQCVACFQRREDKLVNG